MFSAYLGLLGRIWVTAGQFSTPGNERSEESALHDDRMHSVAVCDDRRGFATTCSGFMLTGFVFKRASRSLIRQVSKRGPFFDPFSERFGSLFRFFF